MYDRALTPTEREAVGRYLSSKYALDAAAAAPATLNAVSLNDSQVSVAWTLSTPRNDRVVYEIERKTGAGGYAKIAEPAR